jgi:drug/metabolite transporter (DMT)-like permease
LDISTALPLDATPEKSPVKGALLVTLAFLLVATMSAFAKEVSRLSPVMIAFFQNFLSLLILMPWILRHGVKKLKTDRRSLHFFRAMMGLFSQILMFMAIKHMPLMNAVLLSNSAPLFIPLVAWIWLKEKVAGATWISLAVGFVGVVFILNPGADLFRNVGAVLAIFAAICSSAALVSVNKLAESEPVERILFYYFLLASLATGIFLPFVWEKPTFEEWRLLFGIGFCMAISQLLIIMAYRFANASVIAPYNYSVVVFSGLIDWLIWHTLPHGWEITGIELVCLGGVLSTVSSSPRARGHFLWIGHRKNRRFREN